MIKTIYKLIVPNRIRSIKSYLKNEYVWHRKASIVRRQIINSLSCIDSAKLTEEHRMVLDFLKKNKLKMLPYSFQDEYLSIRADVHTDHSNGLKYVFHNGLKLYMKKGWSNKRIRKYYNYLLAEQDIRSPHCYLTPTFDVNQNDVVVDAGAAEGIFALNVINKVKQVFLFEPDQDWVEALNATFDNFSEKVIIVNKALGSINTDNTCTLDSYMKPESDIHFLKIDVEGSELDVLKGAVKLLKHCSPKISVCTYHRHDHETLISEFLKGLHFGMSPSSGYLIYIYDNNEPYVRRGLIRAEKRHETNYNNH